MGNHPSDSNQIQAAEDTAYSRRRSNNRAQVLPYRSIFRVRQTGRYVPSLGRPDSPLSTYEFNRVVESCPLPPDVYRPFPSVDQRVGSVVRSFHCTPPGTCYTKGVSRAVPGSVFYRVHLCFLPNDEAHLFVAAGVYGHRTGLSPIRLNSLLDGLVSRWTLDSEACRVRIVRGTRSPDCPGFSMAKGRILAWPGNGGSICLFDRHSAAIASSRSTRPDIDCIRAVALAPSASMAAVITARYRQFRLTWLASLHASVPLAPLHSVNLTDLDPTLALSPAYRERVALKWSADSYLVAVSSSEGHLLLVSPRRGDVPGQLAPVHHLRLSGIYAWDFAPRGCIIAYASSAGIVTVYNAKAETGIVQRRVKAPEAPQIQCLCYSTAGQLIAIGDTTGTVTVLDAVTLAPIRELEHPVEQPGVGDENCGVVSLAFSCSDRYLATATSDGLVQVWCLERQVHRLDEMIRIIIRARVPRRYIAKLPLPPAIQTFLLQEVVPASA